MASLADHAAGADAEASRQAAEAAVESKRPTPGFTQRGNRATLTLDLDQKLTDIPTLLAHFDIDPEAWHVERVVPKVWESFSKLPDGQQQRISLRYLSVSLVPKAFAWQLSPAACTHSKPAKALPIKEGRAQLVAVMSDQQSPFYDEQLHELVLRWLDVNRPARLVVNGDALDLPSLSRHRRNPGLTLADAGAELQRGLDSTHRVLGDYIQAAQSTDNDYGPGNHEWRWHAWLLDNAPVLYGIRAADASEALFTIPTLLGLEKLGYRWVFDPNGYEHSKILITEKLAAMHGWIARQKSGHSALATLEHLGHSVIIGHTHRQAQVFHTVWELGGQERILTAAEGGALCKARGGLGYAPNPNWQQGFVSVWVYPDGTFKLDLAQYVGGVLLWGDQRYWKTSRGVRVAA